MEYSWFCTLSNMKAVWYMRYLTSIIKNDVNRIKKDMIFALNF